MELRHPIDEDIRARLRALDPNQSELGKQIGRHPSWVNKYLSGAGHATIDDLVRIAAVLFGATTAPVSEAETRLLRAFRALSDDDRREDAIASLAAVAKAQRQQQQPGSGEQTPRTPLATGSTRRGRRRVAKG